MAASNPELQQSLTDVKQKGKLSPWYPPNALQEPVLQVYNSLTKEKVPFQPMFGRQVKWYNCGPTVYDASHLGHARNYVSQDIIRRILVDYFGYDLHFVMNITDIDDKIIIRARQNHLIEQLIESTTFLTPELVSQTQEAWSAYFHSKVAKILPETERPASEALEELESVWARFVKKETSDPEWWNAAKAADEKFTMNLTALKISNSALLAAAQALSANDPSPEHAKLLINSSKDVLAPYLDKKHGSSLTDPSISRSLAAYWEDAFFKDMARLRVLPPDTTTRVTEYVPEIAAFVDTIVKNRFGYVTDDGSVYFDTRAFDGSKSGSQQGQEEWQHFYAKLQPGKKGNKEALEEGEGALSSGVSKRHPSDFALWKASKPGEPAWPSPWGPGRPGWHIECSVMASEILGESMDIHSGGVDLMFPHHDNEIAQAEAYHDCRQWVNYFLHTGHLHIEGLKMSKSLKNFISVEDALSRYSARQLRLSFLFQLWSSPMDFKESSMQEVRAAETVIDNFFNVTKALIVEARSKGMASDGKHHYDQPEKELATFLRQTQHSFRVALCDSFNTPEAIQRLLELISRTNVYLSRGRGAVNVGLVETIASWITKMLRMFGLNEGPVVTGLVGWGEEVKEGAGAGGGDRESILLPYLQVLSSFRDTVRQLAIAQASSKEILMLCDKLRDVDLAPLGVALDDQDDGKALVKFVSAEALQRQREEKLATAAAKAAKKAAAQEAEKAKKQARLEKGKISPRDMFKPPNVAEGTYGSWNEDGLPLTDTEGVELSKAKTKKLQKDLEIQRKAHEEYSAWLKQEAP